MKQYSFLSRQQSFVQRCLRQRFPRALYMSLWQFFRHTKIQTYFMMSVSLSQPAFLLFKLLGILFFDMKPGTINLLRASQTNTIGFTNGFSKLAFVVRYGHKFRRISANDIASCSLVGFRSVCEHGASWSDTRRNVLQDARSRHFLCQVFVQSGMSCTQENGMVEFIETK